MIGYKKLLRKILKEKNNKDYLYNVKVIKILWEWNGNKINNRTKQIRKSKNEFKHIWEFSIICGGKTWLVNK